MRWNTWGLLGVLLLALLTTRCAPFFVFPDVANIAYGDGHVRQRLDLYLPNESDGPVPVIVYFHGGGWESGDKTATTLFAARMMAQGFAVASANYRLSQHTVFPAQLHDAKAAVRWVRANASDYGLDGERIAVWGDSAGGHLAALVGTTGNVAELEGDVGKHVDVSSRVQAVVDCSGPSDLLGIMQDVTVPPGIRFNYDLPDSFISRLIGFDRPGEGLGVLRYAWTRPDPVAEEKRELLELASPIHHVSADDPPFFLAHGMDDDVVPFKQTGKLADALQAAGVYHESIMLSGAGHALPASVQEEALAFLRRELGEAPPQWTGAAPR